MTAMANWHMAKDASLCRQGAVNCIVARRLWGAGTWYVRCVRVPGLSWRFWARA
jgi:hypothetical protein